MSVSRSQITASLREMWSISHHTSPVTGSGWLARDGRWLPSSDMEPHAIVAEEAGLIPVQRGQAVGHGVDVAKARGHVRVMFFNHRGQASLNVQANRINPHRKLQIKNLFSRWDHPAMSGGRGNVMVETDTPGTFPNEVSYGKSTEGKYHNFPDIHTARKWADTL